MRLICQEVDALAVLQLYKFSDERLLTGVSLNYRPRLWIQPIDATHSLNISAGVLYPKVFLGRSFNFLAIASNSSCE